MGRPRIEFSNDDWILLSKLCGLHCTLIEIAYALDVSEDTIERRIRERFDCTFAEYYKRESAGGKSSLRRMMWKSAEKGSVPMQIFMSKNLLGYRDIPDPDPGEDQPFDDNVD